MNCYTLLLNFLIFLTLGLRPEVGHAESETQNSIFDSRISANYITHSRTRPTIVGEGKNTLFHKQDFTKSFHHLRLPFENITWKSSEHKTKQMQQSTSLHGKEKYSVIVDAAIPVVNMSYFWKSTGFCPPNPHQRDSEWFLSKDVTLNLAYIGALPHSAVDQVRIHWLYDAVTVASWHHRAPVYNFTALDDIILQLWSNGLHPGFELMGNPSNIFTDFENRTQVYMWRDLVQQTAQHFIDQYGLGYVSTWNFESWNEPNKHHFDNLTMTLQGFMNYYDASSEGLYLASSLLRLGGPGGECPDAPDVSYCWQLLLHCLNGTNYFTGQTGVRLDYISIHKKGGEPNNTAVIFSKETKFLTALRHYLPKFGDKPIYNDEADPLVTWSKDLWWRADVTYAAMVTKVIVEHQHQWLSTPSPPVHYALLSNDNGFLSYHQFPFTQRTLLARFQINSTSPPHVQFIRKPIYSVMGMLSLLGETQVKSTVSSNRTATTHYSKASPDLSYNEQAVNVLATIHTPDPFNPQDSWMLSAVLYHSMDSQNVTGQANMTITFNNLPSHTELRYAVYIMDNHRSNPHAVWQAAGQPQEPSTQVFQAMRQAEEPDRVIGPASLPPGRKKTDSMHLLLPLDLPSVALILFCAHSTQPPDQVSDVTLYPLTAGQLLITWSDSCVHARCVKTYEVEYSKAGQSGDRLWQRINPTDTMYNSFVYMTKAPGDIHGAYRVRAMDYWSRPGEYSPVVQF